MGRTWEKLRQMLVRVCSNAESEPFNRAWGAAATSAQIKGPRRPPLYVFCGRTCGRAFGLEGSALSADGDTGYMAEKKERQARD